MNTRTVIRASTFVSLLLSAAAGAQTPAPQLALTKIPSTPGAQYIAANYVDAKGNVYGSDHQLNTGGNLIEWLGGSTPVAFPRLPADQNDSEKSYGFSGVNAAGAVVGGSFRTSVPQTQGIYWDASRHPSVVANAGTLVGISDTGILIGTTHGAGTDGTAAYWASPTSQPTNLPYPTQIDCADPIGNLCYSWTQAISPNGKYIVGLANLLDYHSPWGIMWVNGQQVSNFGGRDVSGVQVTNTGIVIGSHDTQFESDGPRFYIPHAFKWEAGTLTDLGCLPGAPADTTFESDAQGINSSGVIVGSSFVAEHVIHAVMWMNDQIIDLNTTLGTQLPPGWHLAIASSINDAGEITLLAQNDDTGESAYYLAKPLIGTHTTITSNINPSTYGQEIHLVAKVSPDSGPVPTTGSVSWYDNGVLQGTARMTAIGTSSWEPATWTGGVHNVTAVWPGSGTLGASTSPVFKQTVNAASTRTTISASANPATHGQAVQFTATVVPTSGTIAGTVTFKSGSTVLGTGTLDARTKQTHFTTTFAKGSYAITAVFAGSQNFVASNSAALTLTVK